MLAVDLDAAVSALDRLAKLDGYRVRRAADHRQHEAWRGQYGVFCNGWIRFTASQPDGIRAWLYDQARRVA